MEDEKKKYIYYGIIAIFLLFILGGALFLYVSYEEKQETVYTTVMPLEESDTVVVYVTGGVRYPGVYEVRRNSRLYEAVQIAGDVIPYADTEAVNMSEVIRDAQKIYIPIDVTKGNPSAGDRVNINTADVRELQTLQGVGEKTAQKIVEYRKTHGLFKKKEDLKNVPSIGEKKYLQWLERITL